MRDACVTLRCDWNTYGHLLSSVLEHCQARVSILEQQSKSNQLKKILKDIQEYDGYQLRFKEKKNCYHGKPYLKKPPSSAYRRDKCIMLKWQGAARRRMYPYLFGYIYKSSDPNLIITASISWGKIKGSAAIFNSSLEHCWLLLHGVELQASVML